MLVLRKTTILGHFTRSSKMQIGLNSWEAQYVRKGHRTSGHGRTIQTNSKLD